MRPANWGAPLSVVNPFCKRVRDFVKDPDSLYELARAPLRRLGRWVKRTRRMKPTLRMCCVAVLEACAHRCDFPTMRVCVPHKNDRRRVRGVYMTELAELAGLEIWQATRAITALERAGYLSRHPRVHQSSPGVFEGRATIYVLNAALFVVLGLKKKLGFARGEKDPQSGTRAEGRKALAMAAAKAWTKSFFSPRWARRAQHSGGPDPP